MFVSFAITISAIFFLYAVLHEHKHFMRNTWFPECNPSICTHKSRHLLPFQV